MTTETETTRLPTAVRKALRRLGGTAKTLAAAILASRAAIAEIQANADLTLAAQMQQMTEKRDQLQEVAGKVEIVGAEAFAEVEGAAMAGEDGSDPTAALLHESRLGRAWARVRAQLDAGRDLVAIGNEAQKASDRLVFEALREEYPGWLQAHGRGAEVESSATIISSLEAPLRTPEEQALASALERATRLNEFVRINVGTVRLDNETTSTLLRETEDGEGREAVAPERVMEGA